MAILENDSFQVNTPILPDDLNEKFEGIALATDVSLTGENLRDEAVDGLQFVHNTTDGKQSVVLRDWLYVSNGVGQTGGTTYTSTVNTTPAEALDHGSTNPRLVWPIVGTELADGDLLRVRWSVFVQDVTVDTSLFAATPFLQADQPVWLIWLQWDITSASLTDWEEVPGQGDLLENFVAGEGSPTSECVATMTVAHGFTWTDGVDRMVTDVDNMSHQRGYAWVNDTGDDITIYGIRLVINGLYHPERSADTGLRNAFQKDNSSPGWSGEDIRIANVNLLALIMRSA